MAPGIKTGGRKIGSVNRATRTRRAVAESIAQGLAQLDRNGKTMAEIQIESARYIWDLAEQERARPEPQQEAVVGLMTAASKVAHHVSSQDICTRRIKRSNTAARKTARPASRVRPSAIPVPAC